MIGLPELGMPPVPRFEGHGRSPIRLSLGALSDDGVDAETVCNQFDTGAAGQKILKAHPRSALGDVFENAGQ